MGIWTVELVLIHLVHEIIIIRNIFSNLFNFEKRFWRETHNYEKKNILNLNFLWKYNACIPNDKKS